MADRLSSGGRTTPAGSASKIYTERMSFDQIQISYSDCIIRGFLIYLGGYEHQSELARQPLTIKQNPWKNNLMLPSDCIILVVPEDVPTGLVAIYGFTPRIVKGKDHRFGFGFRFGNHADFQVMYELGPQTITRPIQPLRARSALYSERIVKRRPLIDLLLRIGLLKEASLGYDVTYDEKDDEPR